MRSLVEAVLQASPGNEYLLIVTPGTEHLLPHPGECRLFFARSPYYSVSEQFEIPQVLEREKVEVLHAPHFVVPLWKKCPTLVTIHDTIHLIYPQDLPSMLGRTYARIMMNAAVRIADEVITVSHHAKSEIVRFLQVPASKVTVIPSGVSSDFARTASPQQKAAIREKFGICGDYVLYTGIYKERKNHVGLFRAFAVLLRRHPHLSLVIAGPLAEGEASLRQQAAELGIADHVRFTGFVSDEDLPILYAGAAVYACPSLYEGFGFTVLEAMACGVPVVANNATSLPEVCGDAAILSDATQPEKFAEAMEMALEPGALRDSMIDRGLENVKRYSWRKAADEVVQVYARLCKHPRLQLTQ